MAYSSLLQLFDASRAFVWSAGDGKTLNQIVGDEFRIDPLFNRPGNIEGLHKSFHSRKFLRRDRFEREAKVMVCPVCEAAAHKIAGLIPVVIDTNHPGRYEIDIGGPPAGFGGPLRDLFPGPTEHAKIKTRAQNDAVRPRL